MNAIEARRIALSQQQAQNNSLVVETGKRLNAAKKIFVNFRYAYTNNMATTKVWPTKIDNNYYSEEMLRSQIITLKNTFESEQLHYDKLLELQMKIREQLDVLDQKRNQVTSTQNELNHNLQIVRVNQTISGLDQLQDDIAGVLAAAQVVSDSEGLPTVDSLIRAESKSVSDEDFQAILNTNIR
jgi:hypothetical protein